MFHHDIQILILLFRRTFEQLTGSCNYDNKTTTGTVGGYVIATNNAVDNDNGHNRFPDDDNYKEACKSIAIQIENDKSGLLKQDMLDIIKKTSSKYHLHVIPKREHIIAFLSYNNPHRKLLTVKPTRTASGVAVIAVMPKPFGCPHGRCIYCPGGIEFNTPMSYTGTGPSTKVAQSFQYDPYKQIKSKLYQLRAMGHDIGKAELVIVGGTFPFMPTEYQKGFVKSCFDALNDTDYSNRSSSSFAADLQEAIEINETASVRCVGFTVETKPDYCNQKHIDLMLELGITRIEIGIQSLRDEVYKEVNRGHTLGDVIQSFRLARDAGYKIVAHMMPGLPNSSVEKDIQDFKRLFQDPLFKPDMLKIYPTLVLKNTGLYKLYNTGNYSPYSDDDMIDLLIEVKKMVPPWIRIMRVQREIESKDIIAGPKKGNLRQIVLEKLKKIGLKCNCIRCREIGLQKMGFLSEDEVTMNRIDYAASDGQEVFLSFETENRSKVLGFLRLRKVTNPYRNELQFDELYYDNNNNNDLSNDSDHSYPCADTKDLHQKKNILSSTPRPAAVVRELHVYGQMINVGNRGNNETCQHRGYGGQLMAEAEKIAKYEFGVEKLSVISAIGTREYYKKMGYVKNGPYVSKALK